MFEQYRDVLGRGEIARRQEEYSEPMGNCPKDPYTYSHVFYIALKTKGFPLQLLEGATDSNNQPLERYYRIMVDNQETYNKITRIQMEFFHTNLNDLLNAVDHGYLTDLQKLMRGEEPINSLQSPRQYPISQHDWERCYLRAYQRDQALYLQLLEQGHHPYHREFDPFHEQIDKRKVQSIDPEALGGLIMPAINDIIKANSNLRPPRRN